MGRKKLEIKQGEKYNRLTIQKEIEPRVYEYPSGQIKLRRVEVLCECGVITTGIYNHIKQGNIKSCGCLKREELKNRHK